MNQSITGIRLGGGGVRQILSDDVSVGFPFPQLPSLPRNKKKKGRQKEKPRNKPNFKPNQFHRFNPSLSINRNTVPSILPHDLVPSSLSHQSRSTGIFPPIKSSPTVIFNRSFSTAFFLLNRPFGRRKQNKNKTKLPEGNNQMLPSKTERDRANPAATRSFRRHSFRPVLSPPPTHPPHPPTNGHTLTSTDNSFFFLKDRKRKLKSIRRTREKKNQEKKTQQHVSARAKRKSKRKHKSLKKGKKNRAHK